MGTIKKHIGINVLTAAESRISEVFDQFPRVYLSFSGGKDSGVMFHIAAKEVRRRKIRFGLLIIDLEAQYSSTIHYVKEMVEEYADCIDLYWVALPIALRNAVSVYQPKWECWDPDQRKNWVRNPDILSITDPSFFPFFERGMEFEEFAPAFGEWYSQGQQTACLVGIRTGESLNRWRTITNQKKETFKDRCWTTRIKNTQVYNVYPIYDWKTRDIWIYNSRFKKKYNRLYDLMHQAGLTISQQRICQPYGDDQKQGLWLYHVIEPETWARIVSRVAGANSGAEFVQFTGNASGKTRISKPDGHTWQSFTEVILSSLPKHMSEHYRNKIFVFLKWYKDKGYPEGIPDEADPKLEASMKAPSWRRIARMLLRNDYWAKGLCFAQTKHGSYEHYLARMKQEREEVNRENNQINRGNRDE